MKNIIEKADAIIEQIQNGASQSDVIQFLEDASRLDKAIQHRDTRYAAIDEVNKTFNHLEQLHKDGLMSEVELYNAFNSLQSRIMNLPENGANQL